MFQNVWAKVVQFGQAIASLWNKVAGILAPIINFGKFVFMWLTPLGLVINVISTLIDKFDRIKQGIENAKNAMKGFKSDADAKLEAKQKELDASQANGKSTTDVNVNLKAEKGTKVTKTKVKTTGRSNTNVGVNQGGKGR